jgi:hypothetical protein
MPDIQYGFYKENHEDFTIDVLRTGDGKSQFVQMINSDGTVGIGISYGVGNGVIGEVQEIHRRMAKFDSVKWAIKFDNVKSVQAMISSLEGVQAMLEGVDSIE